MIRALLFAFLAVFLSTPLQAQPQEAPPREAGQGPYDRLVLRGAMLIDGTGAPPRGPVDIVIEDDRIATIQPVGTPGALDPDDERPAGGDRTIDASGMYVLPGFVDLHAHLGGTAQGTTAEYVLKLWMAHGITTVRENASGNGIDWTFQHRRRSAANEITAPRIEAYVVFGKGWEDPIATPDEAREWVRYIEERGADGIKFFGADPAVLKAALDEAAEQGLRTAMHHAQLHTTQVDVLDTATWGLTTAEHFYAFPEALYTDRAVQDYPADYNYQNEQKRFAEAGRMWQQAADPGSARWNAVLDSLLELDLTLVPTFNIYEAGRNFMRTRRAEWHDTYTLPALWEFFRPSKRAHGSYHYYWTTRNETDWKEHYDRWMQFVEAYNNRGGRVATGSDSGFIYQLYGFGFIREMELMQEAGFHPLEVIRTATLEGAGALGRDDEIGSIRVGKKADLVLIGENPVENLKVLYGTGAVKLNSETDEVERVGGVRYTIKDGIIYDASALLEDVEQMVREAKTEAGIPHGEPMPVVTTGE